MFYAIEYLISFLVIVQNTIMLNFIVRDQSPASPLSNGCIVHWTIHEGKFVLSTSHAAENEH